jgi:hypothetical protein
MISKNKSAYRMLFDNAGTAPRLIAKGKNGGRTIIDRELYARIFAAGGRP